MKNMAKTDQDRVALFKKYGYDIPKARRFIIARAGLPRKNILEVGTGRGHMAIALAGQGFRLVSIDLDKKAQAQARAGLKRLKLGGSVLLKKMNAEKLSFRDRAFDAVVSVNFIHHAKDPARCLNEMIRVAAKKIVIADLNRRGQKIMEKVHALDGHTHPPSKMSMSGVKGYLKKKGLTVTVHQDTCQTLVIAIKGERT